MLFPQIYIGGLALLIAFILFFIRDKNVGLPLWFMGLFTIEMLIGCTFSFGIGSGSDFWNYLELILILTFFIQALIILFKKETQSSLLVGGSILLYALFRFFQVSHFPGVFILGCLVLPLLLVGIIFAFVNKKYQLFWPLLPILVVDWLFELMAFIFPYFH